MRQALAWPWWHGNAKPTRIFLVQWKQVEQRLAQCSPEAVVLSAIVVSELQFGAANSAVPTRNQATLKTFLSGFEVLAYGHHAAEVCGDIRASLRRSGTLIGSTDMFIAAHALANGFVLVTNNVREFGRISQLQIENWTLPKSR